MLNHNRVLTYGKWAQDPSVYNETYYPMYASGPAYILGADLVDRIFRINFTAHVGHRLANEDTTVGVWVQKENSTTRIDYAHFMHEQGGCRKGVYLAMNLKPGHLSCM